jgi:hypothetical protein
MIEFRSPDPLADEIRDVNRSSSDIMDMVGVSSEMSR